MITYTTPTKVDPTNSNPGGKQIQSVTATLLMCIWLIGCGGGSSSTPSSTPMNEADNPVGSNTGDTTDPTDNTSPPNSDTTGNDGNNGDGDSNTNRVSNGFLMNSQVASDNAGNVLVRGTHELNAADNTITVSTVFGESEPATSIDTYDDSGSLIRRESFGAGATVETFQHDASGNLIMSSATGNNFLQQTSYSYNANNQIQSRSFTQTGAQEITANFEYAYSDSFVLVSRTSTVTINGAPQNPVTNQYSFNNNGQLQSRTADSNSDGNIDAIDNYEYNSDGNMVRLIHEEFQVDNTITNITEFGYIAVDEPVFNAWLRNFAFLE